LLAYHLSLLPWSCFASLTSGVQDGEGHWHFVPRSRSWWLRSVFGWLRAVCAQQGSSLKAARFVVRFELSELQGLLHVHVLLWTGRRWNISDAMRANAAWRKSGNGTRHCTPYAGDLAGPEYICKGLEIPELGGLSYELAKTELIDSGALMVDDNTSAELHRILWAQRREVFRNKSTGGPASAGLGIAQVGEAKAPIVESCCSQG